VRILKKIINGLFTFLDKGLFYWDISLMSGVVILVILTVLLRYVFNIVFNWTEELIVFLFIGTTFFGIIIGVKENEHIKISLLKDRLPEKIRMVLDIIICCIDIIVVMGSAYFSINWIQKVGRPLTSGLKIPYAAIYMILPISFLLVAIYESREIASKVNDLKESIKKS
jgi:TRAP-type C4-dicarboxylate transport system permease small subunit